MAITKKQALQIAFEQKEADLKQRFKVVGKLDGDPYMPREIDLGKYWIVHLEPEEAIIDGRQEYILVDKETGGIINL